MLVAGKKEGRPAVQLTLNANIGPASIPLQELVRIFEGRMTAVERMNNPSPTIALFF
jgi:hypothetical protein